MGTGKLGRLDLGRGPELFFDCLSGWRQFRGGGTSDQDPFNDRSRLRFRSRGCHKKFHFIRVGKRCGLYRYHRATFLV
jgi:hypothetical protein